jgi:hypothetical protein
VSRALFPRCCVEAAAASLSGARASSHLGRDCQSGWTCWSSWTCCTSWTRAAAHLILHHGPLYVARRRRCASCLSSCLSGRRETPQCAAAAAAHPGRAGIPLSIQLVGHESGPGSAEACLPNPPSTLADRASIRCHRPLSLHCLWRCSPTVSPTNAPHDDGLPISRDTCLPPRPPAPSDVANGSPALCTPMCLALTPPCRGSRLRATGPVSLVRFQTPAVGTNRLGAIVQSMRGTLLRRRPVRG